MYQLDIMHIAKCKSVGSKCKYLMLFKPTCYHYLKISAKSSEQEKTEVGQLHTKLDKGCPIDQNQFQTEHGQTSISHPFIKFSVFQCTKNIFASIFRKHSKLDH